MDDIETMLHTLGKQGIAQDAPAFPEEGDVKKRYAVHHDAELKEYFLVFWYGTEKKLDYQMSNRHSGNFHDILFVPGQMGFIFIFEAYEYPAGDQWRFHHYNGTHGARRTYPTVQEVVQALQNRDRTVTTPPTMSIIDWKREVKMLSVRVGELVEALRGIGERWQAQTDGSKEGSAPYHYSERNSPHSGVHGLALWRGTGWDYPWRIDMYDSDWEYFIRGVVGKYAVIQVVVHGYDRKNITAFVTNDREFDNINDLVDYIENNLDAFYQSK